MSHFSRRSLFKGAAGLAGAAALSKVSPAFARTAPYKTTLLVVFLEVGYNSLFASADSFLGSGDFGVSAGNVKQLANGLAVDAPTFGTMPQYAQEHMASVGIRHGLTAHEAAQPQMVTMGARSSLLMLARDIGGEAAIKAAVVGSKMPEGPRPAEGDVSLQGITDMKATIHRGRRQRRRPERAQPHHRDRGDGRLERDEQARHQEYSLRSSSVPINSCD